MRLTLGSGILAVATVVAAVSVVAGIVIVGSPAEGRLEQLDAGRLADLQNITYAIDASYEASGALPASLEELARDPRTQVNTVDPGTLSPYEYRVIDADSYELCATFDREALTPQARAPTGFWIHPAGRHCFQLEAVILP